MKAKCIKNKGSNAKITEISLFYWELAKDGKIVHYDVKPLLEKEVFAVLKDIEYFMKTCTIMNDTLAWDIAGNRDNTKCIDIDPDTLYKLDAVKEIIA